MKEKKKKKKKRKKKKGMKKHTTTTMNNNNNNNNNNDDDNNNKWGKEKEAEEAIQSRVSPKRLQTRTYSLLFTDGHQKQIHIPQQLKKQVENEQNIYVRLPGFVFLPVSV